MELLVPRRQSVPIELNGKRVVSASAVKCVRVKECKAIRVFGGAKPVAWLGLSPSYRLELSRLSDLGQSISRSSLWEMNDFRLVTVRDGAHTVYSGCEWQGLAEQADARNDFLAEHAVAAARKRSREEEPI